MAKKRDPQLVRIHMARKQLEKTMGMDDSSYRALLLRVGGHDSSAKMTPAQRNAVIAEMVRLGFKEKPRKPYPGAPANIDQVPMLGKVEALLADSSREWAYAHAMADRMFGVDRVEWLRHDQLHKLVAALQVDANRRGK